MKVDFAVWVEKTVSLNCRFFFPCDVGYDPEIVKQWFVIQFLQSETKQILILVCFMMAVDSSFKLWFLYPMWTCFFCTILSVQVWSRSWLKWSMISLWVRMVPIVQYDRRFFAWRNAILTLPSKIECEECAKASLGYCSPSVSWSLYLSNSYLWMQQVRWSGRLFDLRLWSIPVTRSP